mgnify:CR=1 FL=1
MNKIDIKVERVNKVSNILLDYGFSYNAVCKMLRTKHVRIDNNKISIDQDVFAGQTVTCFCKELPENKFLVVFDVFYGNFQVSNIFVLIPFYID